MAKSCWRWRCESAGIAFVPVRSILCLQLIIASNFDRAVIHQVCDMSANCLCSTQSATALLRGGGCWAGAVLAVDARSEHSELALPSAGRKSNLLSKYTESVSLLQRLGISPRFPYVLVPLTELLFFDAGACFPSSHGEVLGGKTQTKWCFAGLDIWSAFPSDALILWAE